MSLSHRVTAVCALALFAVGFSGCATEEQPPKEEVVSSAAAEPTVVESEPVSDLESEDSLASDDENAVMDVEVVGDQGILALQRSGSVVGGTAGPSGGKLITGPGGCFALTDNDRPRLLVFPEDSSFELQQGKPSATFGGSQYYVGQKFTADLTEVPLSSVDGIPDRCSQGADDTVLIIE